MKQRRIVWHIVFWLVQYGISLYNELYLSKSFSAQPAFDLFLRSAGSLVLLLLIKIALTYYILYSLIPRWIKYPRKIRLYAEALVMILGATLVFRVTMQQIIWKFIYDVPSGDLSISQIVARYFYSLLDILQVVGLAAAIKLFKLRIHAIQNERFLVQEKLRSELLHLKAQVNPHFLFNTINSIYSLTRAQSPLAPEAVMRLSKILRYMLYETGEKTTPLDTELKIIEDYIELQQLRFGTRLKVEMTKDIENDSAYLAPLLLLPLVENAFKHGSQEGGKIEIRISLKKDVLHFRISNPLSHSAFIVKEEEGIGLANIRRQLELLYPGFNLEIQASENIFCVELKIDLANYAGFELFNNRG